MSKCFRVTYDAVDGFAKTYCNELKIIDDTLVLDGGRTVISLKVWRSIGIARVPHYPCRCCECGKEAVNPAILPCYNLDFKRDGIMHQTQVQNLHVLKCDDCGELLFTDDTNDQTSQAIDTYMEKYYADQSKRLEAT
jgi:hypothetical protein